jgi:hypothetical protein
LWRWNSDPSHGRDPDLGKCAENHLAFVLAEPGESPAAPFSLLIQYHGNNRVVSNFSQGSSHSALFGKCFLVLSMIFLVAVFKRKMMLFKN